MPFKKALIISTTLFVVFYSLLNLLFTKFLYIGINFSPSLPQKYLIGVRNTRDIKKGDLIVFRFKGDDFAPKGLQFFKKVVCVPGDKLEVNPQKREFYCNGKFIGRALNYSCKEHKPVYPFVFNGTIPKGKYFVIGTDKCSYDSRYWGFVDKSQIVAKILWTFGRLEDK